MLLRNERFAASSGRLTSVGRVKLVLSIVIFISDVFLVTAVNSNESCPCGVGICDQNQTASKCASGRLIARKDCSCCLVCAKQLSEVCNDAELLCDTDFGLICGLEGKCQPETSCLDDTECSADRFCFGGACADPCKVLPDVCRENGPANGVCSVRNHRGLCACPAGQTIAEGSRECTDSSGTPPEKEEKPVMCHLNGSVLTVGERVYRGDKCSEMCECGTDERMICSEADSGVAVDCKAGFIPILSVTGEMTEACRILIGNMTLFDGCCVPEGCQNVTTQDHLGINNQDYRLKDSHNNVRGEDDEFEDHGVAKEGITEDGEKLSLSREMLLSGEDHKVEDEATARNESLIVQDVLEKDAGIMEVKVVKITTHTASIKLPVNARGAILSIALTSHLNETTDDEVIGNKIWKEHMIPPGLEMLTLSDLTPNNSYTVKYTVGNKTYPELQFSTPVDDEGDTDDTNRQFQIPADEIRHQIPLGDGKTSPPPVDVAQNESTTPRAEEEAINSKEADTLNTNEAPEGESATAAVPDGGCLFNNTLHEVGAIVFEGCDQRCECLGNGEMKCIERCSIPFFKNGTFTSDPLCFEEPSGIDDCCVIVACARTSHAGMARELSLNPCDAVQCGPNADCRYEVSPAGLQSESPNEDTLCVCKESFRGDPYDRVKGCELASTSTLVSFPVSNRSLASVPPEKKIEGCVSNNKTFSYGEEYLDGCSYKCHCEASGEFLCLPRCHYRHDEDLMVPEGCEVKKDASDPECCETLHCAGEATEIKREKARVSTDGCLYKNRSYVKEEKFYDGCDQQCMCFTNGDVTCQPRCPPMGPPVLDKDCITLQDPTDSCCNVTICGNQTVSDVMKEAIELEKKRLANPTTERSQFRTEIGEQNDTETFPLKLSMLMPLNESAILISIQIPEDQLAASEQEPIIIFYSTNETSPQSSWSEIRSKVKDLFVEGSDELHTIISGLDPGKRYFIQVEINGTKSNIDSVTTKLSATKEHHGNEDGEDSEENIHSGPSSGEVACHYKSKMFEAGEEFYDGCDDYCVCEDSGSVTCAPIECPTEFGLDLLDAHCVKWEPLEPEGEKMPPNCCSQMKCVQNSSCNYQGFTFNNFEEIPEKLSGCEKRCYCEYGNITCQPACPPLTERPPKMLACQPGSATVMPMPQNECCLGWVCQGGMQNKTNGTEPPLLPNAPSHIDRPMGMFNHSAPPFPPGMRLPPHHLIHQGIIYDEGDQDQLVPPSTGNQPSVIPLDRLHAHQLEELLHRLSTENESGNGGHQTRPFGQGIYVSVKGSAEIRELERNGAKVVGHSTDGSVVLFLPPESHHPNAPPPFPSFPPRPNFPKQMLPGSDQFPFGTHLQESNGGLAHDEITGVIIRALNDSTLHIDFTVSPILVGLQGAVEVSYTNDFSRKPDPAQWEKQLFQQPEDIIDNSHLQLFLSGLKPNSEYHLQIQVIISSIHNSPISDIFVIRTPAPELPPVVKIDPEIKVLETTSRTVEITWRKFTDSESSLIDGVQVKYKAYDDQLYTTSELIHRSIFSYKLINLQPGKKYEIDLLLVPFTNQTTELKSESAIHVETLPEVDDFSFTIALQPGKIGEQSAELIWEGVPFPEDKFIHIYQVLYQSDNQKEQKSYFKVADRETTKKAVLTDLKPGTRYRVWLEAFLTNGKKKRSNVIYVLTKVGSLPSPEKSEQDTNLLHSQLAEIIQPTTSYYGAFVALAIVATLSVIGIIALLMILIRKQSQSKLPINDRKSESSYDNPSFKNCDVEANGHSNKASEL